MPKKTVTIECPWCKKIFPVQIEAKYKDAEAIPQGGNLPKDEGFDWSCPNCPHQLFIRCLRQEAT